MKSNTQPPPHPGTVKPGTPAAPVKAPLGPLQPQGTIKLPKKQ